jgi:antitoxin (DNA-binding transcriptional repressor) of toxin-antitoxin stability system
MKTVSIRELRNRPGVTRHELTEAHEAVLTSNGRPVALMLSVSDETLDETLQAVRLARAQLALRALRRESRSHGLDRLSSKKIDAIINETRRDRKAT